MSPRGLDLPGRRLGRLADPRRAQRAVGQDGFGGGRTDRGGRDTAEGQPQAPVHFGGRHDDQAEVTVPPGELGEAPPARGRELHRLDELVVVQAGLQRAGEQVRGRDLAPAARARDERDRTGRGGHDGEFGGRVGVRQAAAEGAAGADGRVADPAGGLGQQRVLVLRGERAVPGQGADPQPAAGPRG